MTVEALVSFSKAHEPMKMRLSQCLWNMKVNLWCFGVDGPPPRNFAGQAKAVQRVNSWSLKPHALD